MFLIIIIIRQSLYVWILNDAINKEMAQWISFIENSKDLLINLRYQQ